MKALRLALLAPIKRPITPDTTVSRARVIVDLVQGLLKKGHEITLFATADSYLPGATIVGVAPQGLNFMPATENAFYRDSAYFTQTIVKAIQAQTQFDLIHNHMYPEYLPLLALSSFQTPVLTTVHSQMTPETAQTLKLFPSAHLVAISQAAKQASGITSIEVVHNSITTELFKPDESRPKSYLLAVGRMSKARGANGNFIDPKGIANAIKIAQITGEHLKIVGNVEDPEFFETLVKPYVSEKIEFVGEVSSEQTLSRAQMVELFQGATAFINPINWEEPFGLVMAEALACGTPVIAFNRGAVSEIVKDGEVGFIVDPAEGLTGFTEKIKQINTIDRKHCRDYAVEHFATERMVREYEQLYAKII